VCGDLNEKCIDEEKLDRIFEVLGIGKVCGASNHLSK
jgi:hypothetical protein